MSLTRRQFTVGAAGLAATMASGACAAQPIGKGLKDIARSRGLRFGSSIKASQVENKAITTLFKQECDVIVAENAFKWKHIERKPGKMNFGKAAQIADFANENDIFLRGHTLCWNQDNRIPDWMLEAEPHLGANKGQLIENLLIDYIQKATARFPNVASWDVVNEAVQLQDGKIRDSLFTRTIGPGFADLAFHTAKAAAPNAELVYNDYMSWQRKGKHRYGVLKFLEGLKSRDVPIDALGIQSHLGNSVHDHNEKAWREFLDEVQAMGLDVLITELDCNDSRVVSKNIPYRDEKTAAHIKAYLDLTLSYSNVKQVVLWGLTDKDSYTNSKTYPKARGRKDRLPMRTHPYDEKLKAKPMRAAIAEALAAAPKR